MLTAKACRAKLEEQAAPLACELLAVHAASLAAAATPAADRKPAAAHAEKSPRQRQRAAR